MSWDNALGECWDSAAPASSRSVKYFLCIVSDLFYMRVCYELAKAIWELFLGIMDTLPSVESRSSYRCLEKVDPSFKWGVGGWGEPENRRSNILNHQTNITINYQICFYKHLNEKKKKVRVKFNIIQGFVSSKEGVPTIFLPSLNSYCSL